MEIRLSIKQRLAAFFSEASSMYPGTDNRHMPGLPPQRFIVWGHNWLQVWQKKNRDKIWTHITVHLQAFSERFAEIRTRNLGNRDTCTEFIPLWPEARLKNLWTKRDPRWNKPGTAQVCAISKAQK